MRYYVHLRTPLSNNRWNGPYRLRIGEIRVFYDVVDGVVEILAVVPKSETASWLAQFGKP